MNDDLSNARETPQPIADAIANLRVALARVITGYDDVIDDLLVALLARGHILLEGVPGIAKTTMAKTFATGTGLDFRRIQFTQDVLPADITGHYFFNQKTQEFELREGPVFANLLLADEINRAPPKTQSALLESMEERQATIEGRTRPLMDPFMVIATMNPVDVEGVYRLPEAQLDRFMIRTRMDYLDVESEFLMLQGKLGNPGQIMTALKPSDILAGQQAVSNVHVSEPILRYVHAVALATRSDARVILGASPRAMEQMLAGARALALVRGRTYVLPDDVKAIAPRVLNHRLILDVDAEVQGATGDLVLRDIVNATPVPKGEDDFESESPRD